MGLFNRLLSFAFLLSGLGCAPSLEGDSGAPVSFADDKGLSADAAVDEVDDGVDAGATDDAVQTGGRIVHGGGDVCGLLAQCARCCELAYCSPPDYNSCNGFVTCVSQCPM